MDINNKKMTPEESMEFLNEIIDSLIWANMQKSEEWGSFDLTLNYGIWQLKFKAKPENSLRDALNWFKTEIALIKSGVKRDEHNRTNQSS